MISKTLRIAREEEFPRRSVSRISRPGLWGRLALPIVVLFLLCGTGCDDDTFCCGGDWEAPQPPAAVWTETGDGLVTVFWSSCHDDDLAGYRIYRGSEPRGRFDRLAAVGAHQSRFLDGSARNGRTYYYAVSAFDQDGNESDLSQDVPGDTPRPEGSVQLYNADAESRMSGYDFSEDRVVDYRDLEADIYFWHSGDAGPWMIATERSAEVYTDIQDAGFVPLEVIDVAPRDGWSPRGEVPLIRGHSYVVWTWDGHFAKFHVVALDSERVVLEWAYQLDPDNVELSVDPVRRPAGGGVREHEHGPKRRSAS